MWKLALRNIFRHRLRTAMTLCAIVFGVVGLILAGGFVQDIFIQLGEALIHSQTGHLQVARAGFHEKGSRSPEKYLITDPEALRARIAAMPEVDDVLARIAFSGLLGNGRSDLPVIGEGVEPAREARLGSYLIVTAGRRLEDRDAFGLMAGQGLAQALGIKPGDRVTLLVNTADGALNSLDFEVVGIFQSFSKDYDARAVRIPLASAQELLATTGANMLVVSLKRTQDTDAAALRLRATHAGAGLEVKTWIELNDFYHKTVALYERQFGVLQTIILVMVLLSVANSVNMSAFERIGEFGTMMALGNRSGHVFRLVLAENVVLGAAGGLVGLALGIALAWIISAIGIPMPPPPNSNIGYTAYIRIVPAAVLTAAAIGFVATVGAALLPARRVSRIPVVEALRQNV